MEAELSRDSIKLDLESIKSNHPDLSVLMDFVNGSLSEEMRNVVILHFQGIPPLYKNGRCDRCEKIIIALHHILGGIRDLLMAIKKE